MPLFLIVSEIYGRKSQNGEKFYFFRTDTNPPFAFDIAHGQGMYAACMALFLTVAEIYGTK